MPLHLLGKKSWNVYNTDNIDRVRRDETAAAAAEIAEEQRIQEVDAERRLQILRGVQPKNLAAEGTNADSSARAVETKSRSPMRRRLAGENDTDRDIRVAQETYCLRKEQQSLHSEGSSIDKPLTDIRGYISLFPDEPRCTSGLNANVGANHKQKRLESRNSCASRLSDAEGLNASEGKEPWYCTPSGQAPSRHGSDEKNQESDRVESSTRSIKRRSNGLRAEDPLSSMKRGVTGARRVHEERKKWKNEKRREIAELNRSERIDLHRDKLDIRHGKSSDQSRSSKAQHHGRQSQPYDPNSDRPEKFRQR